MTSLANACYRGRLWLSRHYNTHVWWKQQLVYIPWLICTGLGNLFKGIYDIKVNSKWL